MDFFFINTTYELGRSHMWFSVFAGVIAKPVNRLQKLSCCLAVLLSSLLCNIMFFNANRQETVSKRLYYLRLMMIGIESALITVPVQLLLIFLFTYSQKKPTHVNLDEVLPRKHHPVMSEESGFWDNRLAKWYAYETTKLQTREAEKLTSRGNPELSKASRQGTIKTQSQLEKAEAEAPQMHRSTNSNNNNKDNKKDSQDFLSKEPPSQQKPKARILLPWWCVYVAWFLVFAICSISSFFIVFYGLTYGYDLSIQWLFTSFCSFFQSIFLVQTSKIILLSGFRTSKPKYCKNLPWTIKYRYTEIKIHGLRKNPAEKHKQHLHINHIRGTRMYQPLTEDEIRIFQRKKRIKKRALLFLSYILTHFIFLALLLVLIALLHHTDSFYYNQFIRDYFSTDLATVTKLEHIYRWINKVLLPLFHNDLNPTFLFDSSSKILGLPLMRQVRAKPSEKKCLPDKTLVLNIIKREIHCHPKYSRVFYDVRLAQRAIQIALPGICHMAFVVSIYFFVYMAFGYLHDSVLCQHLHTVHRLLLRERREAGARRGRICQDRDSPPATQRAGRGGGRPPQSQQLASHASPGSRCYRGERQQARTKTHRLRRRALRERRGEQTRSGLRPSLRRGPRASNLRSEEPRGKGREPRSGHNRKHGRVLARSSSDTAFLQSRLWPVADTSALPSAFPADKARSPGKAERTPAGGAGNKAPPRATPASAQDTVKGRSQREGPPRSARAPEALSSRRGSATRFRPAPFRAFARGLVLQRVGAGDETPPLARLRVRSGSAVRGRGRRVVARTHRRARSRARRGRSGCSRGCERDGGRGEAASRMAGSLELPGAGGRAAGSR
nr:polycystic kidney disease and receptor for egg jelly-related protein [Loxodonta africana]